MSHVCTERHVHALIQTKFTQFLSLSLSQRQRHTLNIIIIVVICSFMSTLLTTVLTHHSAWIYTVSNDAPDRQEENKHKPKAVSIATYCIHHCMCSTHYSLIFFPKHTHTTPYGLNLGKI